MNFYKIRATIYRDIRECLTNYAVLSLLLLPLMMAALYGVTARNLEGLPDLLIYTVIGVILASVTTNIPLMLYAEENEHGIMKLVIHTKSDFLNNIIGRSILSLVITGILIVLALFILDGFFIISPVMIIGFILAAIVFLNLGLYSGILSKLQSTSSVYGVAILLFLGMTPLIESFNLSEGHMVRTIAELTPVYQLIALHNNVGIMPCVILSVWIVVTVFLVYVAVSKRTKTL